MRALALLPLLILAAACSTVPREPRVVTVEVKVPVPVPCVPKSLRPKPTYPDTDEAILATAGPGDLLHLLAAGRLLRKQREAEVEPVIEVCRRPPTP